jgi:thiol:disulfide interchange protein DsbD
MIETLVVRRGGPAVAKVQRMTRRMPLARALAALTAVVVTLLVPLLAFASEEVAAAGSDTSSFQQAMAKGPFVAAGVAFLGGLLTSMTPCVWPMVAITVSVFGATEAKSRKQGAMLSGVFVLGMATLFTIFGVAAGLSGALFGQALGNPWVVIPISLILLALAASMFGAFELQLPSALTNKLATVGGIGYGGAFTLGLVSAVIAAPCTGPVLTGILAWIALSHSAIMGCVMMASFAFGLGVPFFLVGAFAVSLPKGGAWMLGVKWFFGVMLVVLAAYFIRPAFPALMTLVPRTTTMLTVGAALTLVGLAIASIHVSAERKKSPIVHLSKPTKLISAPFAIAGGFILVSWILTPKAQLKWLDSEDVATQAAKADHRPMIVDFGAAWCGACNELATHTFADAQVREEAGRFVAVRVDATDEDDAQVAKIKDKYHVVGLPTVVVLDSSGAEKVRFNEFVPAERFLTAIKTVN